MGFKCSSPQTKKRKRRWMLGRGLPSVSANVLFSEPVEFDAQAIRVTLFEFSFVELLLGRAGTDTSRALSKGLCALSASFARLQIGLLPGGTQGSPVLQPLDGLGHSYFIPLKQHSMTEQCHSVVMFLFRCAETPI